MCEKMPPPRGTALPPSAAAPMLVLIASGHPFHATPPGSRRARVVMPRSKNPRSTGNYLLDRRPAAELDSLLRGADRVRFAAKQEVYGVGATGQPIYFPMSGVFSLLLPFADGHHVEVSVVD